MDASHNRSPVVEAPTGITFVDYENPPDVTSPKERVESFLDSDRAPWYNHVNVTAHPHGGHFIPWEIPERWTADLVRTFRQTKGHHSRRRRHDHGGHAGTPRFEVDDRARFFTRHLR